MKVYALTGGIATGKSEASRRFVELGIPVLDADLIAHGVMEPAGRAYAGVVERFGENILSDGIIDRDRLADIVFTDKEKLEQLNALVHPAVQLEIADRIAEAASRGEEVLIVDAALHAENGKVGDGMAGLILVDTPREERARRLVENRGMSPEEAERRIAAQTPPERKRVLARWIIENQGSLADLHRRVEAVAEEL